MIFGINTASDISKFLYVISRAVGWVKFETILKYHGWYLCKYHVQIMLLFVYTTTRKRFVIFTCRYFKLSWNTTALSQSNCRNFSCGSISNKFTVSQLFPLSPVTVPEDFQKVNSVQFPLISKVVNSHPTGDQWNFRWGGEVGVVGS